MTLNKIAELTGASVATVSKAFSGSSEISEQTRERIFKAAKELGCFEKYYKGEKTRRLIALIFPEVESEYYATQIGLLEREIHTRGADSIVILTRFDNQETARLFSELAYRLKVDGFIVTGSSSAIKNPDEIPLVSLGSTLHKKTNADHVQVDYSSGMNDMVKLIKEYGHREIGFIGERLTTARLDLFKSAMRQHGLPIHEKYIATSTKRFADAGEDCMIQLKKRGAVPTAIIASYDRMAMGAMRTAKGMGYRLPEDISFVGIDDLAVADYLDVPLTSLHVHLEDVCKRVVDLIFKRIDNRHYRQRQEIVVPVSIALRDSLSRIGEKQGSGM